MTIRVGSGRGIPAEANIVWKVGITKIEQDEDGPHRHRQDHAGVDHGTLDLPGQGVVLLQEGSQAQQDRVQDTAGLTGRHHVHVEVR
jgi:hypothetical protein